MLFAAFFLWLHFSLRSFIVGMDAERAICNTEGPFGTPFPEWLFLPISFGAGVFLLLQWRKEDSLALQWPWLLIMSGGLGNILERELFGCIMDYIALPGLSFFPVFNLADILLTIGVLGIFFNRYRSFQRNHKL